ncbi:hypothetical protein ES703_123186 [subsurface metagenome]
MGKIPEGCPIRDILSQSKSILELLNKILEHCEKCLAKKEVKDNV